MRFASRPLLVLSMACALAACKEPQPTADFSPDPAQAATNAAAADGGLAGTPTELTFDERRAAMQAGGRCNLEYVNGTKFVGQPVNVSKGAPMQLAGWIADVDAKSVPASFDLRLVNTGDQRTWRIAATAGETRADVQAMLGGDAALSATGFMLESDLAALPDGAYRAYLVFAKNGALVACDNGRALVVGP